jgi:hypothetical protein
MTLVMKQAKMANSDDIGDAFAFPSIGLPDPPSVDPIAVACAADEDTLGVTFPVTVAIGIPVTDGKFPPGDEV